ncbi:MAG: hypothetical protein VB070_02430 [Clostridiaceae bacterium]|nr:hypothetical protein [Clostridiaceae bacterium]
MPILDQILLRYLLLTIISGFCFGLFRIGCKVLPRWFSGRLRRAVWLMILLLPVLSLPWPRPIIIPNDTPEWVYHWRLPDPAADYLSEQKIVAANQLYWGSETSDGLYHGIVIETQEPDNPMIDVDPADDSDKTPVQTDGTSPQSVRLPSEILRDVIPGYPILNHLSLLHWIFFSGFLVNILIRLLWRFRSFKKQGRRQQPLIVDDPSWLRDLAQARDRSGFYQRGLLVGIQDRPKTLLPFCQLWRRHAIALEDKQLTLTDPELRQECLILALDANRHPDILLYVLYFANRYLAWFSPDSWLPVHVLTDDQMIWRQQRLKRTSCPGQPVRPAERKPGDRIGRLVTSTLTVLFAGLALAGAVWQNPITVLPDIRQAAEYQKQLMASYNLQISEPERTTEKEQYPWMTLYGTLVGSGSIQYYYEENDQGFYDSGIMMLDDQGGVRWKLAINQVIPPADKDGSYDAPDSSEEPALDANIPLPSRAQIVFQQDCCYVQPDGLIDLAGTIYSEENNATRKISAQISSDGRLLSWITIEQIIPDDYDYTDLEKDYFLADGSLLIIQPKTVPSPNPISPLASSYSAAVPESKTLYNLERRSADGMTSNLFSSDSPLMRQLNLGIWQTGIISCSRVIKDVLPSPDGGFYLIIQENADKINSRNPVIGMLARNITVWPLSLSSTYSSYYSSSDHFESGDQIARISADNQLIWLHRLGSGENLVSVNKGIVTTDNRLLLAATVSFRQAGILLPSYYNVFNQYGTSEAENLYDDKNIYADLDFSGPLYPISEAYQYASLIALDAGGQLIWHNDIYDEYDVQGADLLLQNNCLTFLVTNNPYIPYIDTIYALSQSSGQSAAEKVPDNMSCESIWQYNPDGLLLNCGRLPKAGTNLEHSWIFVQPGSVTLPGLAEFIE